jgi:hypothetical protein
MCRRNRIFGTHTTWTSRRHPARSQLGQQRSAAISSDERPSVGVKCDPLDPADAERSKIVLVLQAPELALDSGAAAVEIVKALGVARRPRKPDFEREAAPLRTSKTVPWR